MTDTLGWTLEQFKTKKLAAMIERAGYPGVSADLDQDLIASVIPAMENRAREMEAGGIPTEPTLISTVDRLFAASAGSGGHPHPCIRPGGLASP